MMCNQTSWHAMEDYAEIHQKDLRKLYFKISGKVLRRYTPSHDVFCAVFQTLSPVTFQNAFKSWLL
ncbi:transposase family protein, partial [uncultured Porphyromonas sp.]